MSTRYFNPRKGREREIYVRQRMLSPHTPGESLTRFQAESFKEPFDEESDCVAESESVPVVHRAFMLSRQSLWSSTALCSACSIPAEAMCNCQITFYGDYEEWLFFGETGAWTNDALDGMVVKIGNDRQVVC